MDTKKMCNVYKESSVTELLALWPASGCVIWPTQVRASARTLLSHTLLFIKKKQ